MARRKQTAPSNIGIAARNHRRRMGLNQSEFWSPIGVSQSVASRYESGRAIPRPVQLLLELVYGPDIEANDLLITLRQSKFSASAREVLDTHISMMEALGRAIAKRDSDTGAHNYRVAWIAARIAETIGLRDVEMQALIAGSFLHDIGKIGIPDSILLKPGKLDEREFDIMRSHVLQGEEIVTGICWLDGANAVVAAHHEKWNGSGYPRALAGEAIPLAARVFAVADVFDALCSKRPYKDAMEFDAAMAILEAETGGHFDPSIVAAFRPIAREIFDRLASCDEHGARQLLGERVRLHFGLLDDYASNEGSFGFRAPSRAVGGLRLAM